MGKKINRKSLLYRSILLSLIFLAALLIRIAYNLHTVIDQPIRADAVHYVNYGYHLAYHKTFSFAPQSDEQPKPDSYRSPGYPLLIALSYLLGGKKHFYPIVLYIQAFLSSVMVFFTFLLAHRFLRWWILYFSFVLAIFRTAAAVALYFCSMESLYSNQSLVSQQTFPYSTR